MGEEQMEIEAQEQQIVTPEVAEAVEVVAPEASEVTVAEAKVFSAEEDEAYKQKLRDEAKRYRVNNAELKAELESTVTAKDEEIESLQSRISELEPDMSTVRLDALKVKYGISEEDATAFFTDDLVKNEEIAKRLSERASDAVFPVVHSEGSSVVRTSVDEISSFAQGFFSRD